ncbi:MAG: hypothetical protein M3Q03_17465 [Chloroflexota bacterium]|nr:hypothetical protein [Chloroflexota bacterium]
MGRLGGVVAALAILVFVWSPYTLAQNATPTTEENRSPAGDTVTPLARATVDELPAGPVDIGLFRLTITPGAEDRTPGESGISLVAMEAGDFTFHLAGEPSVMRSEGGGTPVEETVPAGHPVALTVGDTLLLPVGVRGTVRNDGQEAATAVVLFVRPSQMATGVTPGATTTPNDVEPVGITYRGVFGVVGEELPAGPVVLTIERLTLEVGGSVPSHPHAGPELSIIEEGFARFTGEAGRIELFDPGDLAQVRAAMGGVLPEVAIVFITPTPSFKLGSFSLQEGDGALYHPGAIVGFQALEALGPLVVLSGAIEPLANGGSSEASTPVM